MLLTRDGAAEGVRSHGDRCSRLHTKPTISQTVLLVNIYQSPELTAANDPAAQAALEPRKLQEHFEVCPSPLSLFP